MSTKDFKFSTSLFIGKTSRGLTQPVFWDPHTPIINNKPPVSVITGAPGSGKTFLALLLTAMSTILGKTTVVLDPKGDFVSLAEIKNDIGRFALMDLGKGKPGLLDPFYMVSDPQEQLSLALEVIDIFLGGLSSDDLIVLAPIIKDVITAPNPSLMKVVDELRGSEKERARGLGVQLELLKKMKFAKLCFAPGNVTREPMRISSGLTVFTLVGLELPASDEQNMTRSHKLAAGIMFLLTDFLRRIMSDDTSTNPKTIVIDEAHAILGNAAGQRVVKQMALLGRSKYLALILITQNDEHLKDLNVENTISTRFAFRSSRREAEGIIKAMELPRNEGIEDTILQLDPGECLMKDFEERYSTVQITSYKKEWTEAFTSNPLERLRKQKAAKEAAEAAKQIQR